LAQQEFEPFVWPVVRDNRGPGNVPQPLAISVPRAGELLGISRAAAYRAAARWLDTGGREGLPVVRLGKRRVVVPLAALRDLLGAADRR
jgi:hypothetical protein